MKEYTIYGGKRTILEVLNNSLDNVQTYTVIVTKGKRYEK